MHHLLVRILNVLVSLQKDFVSAADFSVRSDMGAHNMWIYAKNQPIAEVSLSVAEAQCAEGRSVNTCDMWHTC